MARATVIDQKLNDPLHAIQICTVNNGATLALKNNQICPRQHGQMSRHGVVRHTELPGDFTRRKTLRLKAHQKPECLQPGLLGERAEARQYSLYFHASKNMDSMVTGQA